MDAPHAGRVAVVTGSAQGIGRAYAQALAEQGATVVIADLKVDQAAATAEQMSAAGATAVAMSVDVGDEVSVRDLAARVRSTFGRADILVNNAAIYENLQRVLLSEVTIEYWRHLFAVNVESCLTCSREFAPMMRDHGWGRIVNQGSVGAYMANPSAYAVSKLAVVGITQGLAREYGPFGITVNSIAPGLIHTDATMNVVSEARRRSQVEKQAMPIEAGPEHLVETLRYLASDGASFVTGQTIFVDGLAVPRI